MLGIKGATVLSVADGVELKAFPEEDKYFAFNTSTGDHFTLNHTAFWVLHSLEKPMSFSDVARLYLDTFDVSKALGARHLRETIRFALSNALIKEATS